MRVKAICSFLFMEGIPIGTPRLTFFKEVKGTSGEVKISGMIERVPPQVALPVHSGRHPRKLDTRGVSAFYPQRGDTETIEVILKGARA